MNRKAVYETVDKLIGDDFQAVFFVGSFLKSQNPTDVDVFVIDGSSDVQRRVFRELDGVEYDINFFSYPLACEMIEKKTYFFIKSMKDASVHYDREGRKILVQMAKEAYEEGPKCDGEELLELGYRIKELFETIERVKGFKRSYYSMILMERIMDAYFMKRSIWRPKDKKIFEVLQKSDENIYNDITKNIDSFSIEDAKALYVRILATNEADESGI